jgi:hypothetical protein
MRLLSSLRVNAPGESLAAALIKTNHWKHAHVAQSAEHFLGKEEVMGPIPIVGFTTDKPTSMVSLTDE